MDMLLAMRLVLLIIVIETYRVPYKKTARIVYVAKKPIKKDGQLLVNYGWGYWFYRGGLKELNNKKNKNFVESFIALHQPYSY